MPNTETCARVAVAMSGGVDSSVAAALLKERGLDVVGISLRLPSYGQGEEADAPCCGVRGIEDARRVADRIGIPFYALDFRQEFERTVVADFCRAYAEGRTPNPCARCNDWIKFGTLLAKARGFGATAVATGHYARTTRDEATGRVGLRRGADGDDQSYFLYALSQEQLAGALFPVGGRTKDEVRAIARDLGLPVHDKPGSQDLCFLPDGHYRAFLRERCPEALCPGPIVHVDGRVLGRHDGIALFTVGQRRGLGIAHAEPLYVVGFRADESAVIVGERRHVLRDSIAVSEVSWLAEPPRAALSAGVKIRYNHQDAEARLVPQGDGRVRVRFAEPQEAPCPGQAAVFYSGEVVLGGGIIEDTDNDRT